LWYRHGGHFKPSPLSWDEQDQLFKELPPHLHQMALFAVNTGCRMGEILKLRWEWEIAIESIPGGSVFVIPAQFVKNRHERLVVLNDIARSVIENVRGNHPKYVFTYQGRLITDMNNTGWCKARKRAGLEHIRVHDLKHTFGRRLRAANVSLEDRQELLGHKSERMTSHYSAAEVGRLWQASQKVCQKVESGITLSYLTKMTNTASSRKSPASDFC